MLRFSDARNFGRTLTGLLLFAAPAMLLIATLVQPNTDHKNKLQELNAVAAHKGTYLLGGILFLIGGLLMLFVGAALIKLFRGPRGITAGQVSGALLMCAGFVTAGWYALGAAEYEMVNHAGLDRQALAAFLHKAESGGSLVPLIVLFMVGIVIGSILLAVANYRTRFAPVWASVAILLGGIVSAVANSQAANIASLAVLLIGLGAIGARVLSMSDEEWDQPRERYSAPAEPSAPPAPQPAA
ncbi:MAG TPA: DUF4386 family protein [Thermoleophilaceae bacterium]